MKCLKSENNVLMVRTAKGEGVKYGLLAFYGEKKFRILMRPIERGKNTVHM